MTTWGYSRVHDISETPPRPRRTDPPRTRHTGSIVAKRKVLRGGGLAISSRRSLRRGRRLARPPVAAHVPPIAVRLRLLADARSRIRRVDRGAARAEVVVLAGRVHELRIAVEVAGARVAA